MVAGEEASSDHAPDQVQNKRRRRSENNQRRKKRKKRRFKETETGGLPSRRNLGCPAEFSSSSEIGYHEKQSKYYCLLNAFNNLYGRKVLCFEDLDGMRKEIDEIHWKAWREGVM